MTFLILGYGIKGVNMQLAITDLTIEYKTRKGPLRAVDGVKLNVQKGELLGLAGESGCGKTTLGSAVMRILPSNGRITGGSIELDGINLVKLSEKAMRHVRWREISMVFQGAMNAFNPTLTIESQIAEPLIVHKGRSKKRAVIEAREWLDRVGINSSLGKSYPHEFSGGMKQRACIAMALILQPKIVVADEITTALDVMVQAQIVVLLRELQKDLGLSMLIISHDLAVLAEICDKLAIMYAGQLVETGKVREMLSDPLHPYTKGLLLAIPTLRGEGKIPPAIKGAPPSLLNLPSGCRFSPRCPIRMPACCVDSPELIEMGDNHQLACHRRDFPSDIRH